MFLQLLVSELTKAPDLQSEIFIAEAAVKKIGDPKTISDLEELFKFKSTKFSFETENARVGIPDLEGAFVKAKHFQIETDELEDVFV